MVDSGKNPLFFPKRPGSVSFFRRSRPGALDRGTFGPVSAVLGTQLPGPNSLYLGQDLKFVAPVRIGDTVKVVVTVTDKRDEKRIVTLRTTAYNQRGEMVIDGSAVVKKVGS